MATSDSPLSVPDLTLAVARGAQIAQPLVDANFANGNTLSTFDTNNIGFSWGDQSFTSVGVHPESGVNSLIFNYQATPPPNIGEAQAEARFNLGQQFTEVWTQFELYVPSNFKLRVIKVIAVDSGQDISGWLPGDAVVGGNSAEAIVWGVSGQTLYLLNPQKAIFKDGYWSGVTLTNETRSLTATVAAGASAYVHGSNNKFATLWSGNYSGGPTTGGGGTLDVEYEGELDPVVAGAYEDTVLSCKSTETDTSPQTANLKSAATPLAPAIDQQTDPGTAIKYDFHWKRASADGVDDGVCEVFKNEVLVYGRYDLPNYDTTMNYFERGYLLGYSNSGFDENTKFGISRFRVFDSKPF